MAVGRLLTFTGTLEIEECCICGTSFAVAPELMRLVREKTDRPFFCPNGHQMVFIEPVEQKLAKCQAALARANATIEFERTQKEHARAAAAKEQRRLLCRAQAGVCPHCHRTFGALARRMKTKHSDLVGP